MRCMELDERDINEFAEIWKQEFDEGLSAEEARHRASQLLELFWLLSRPLPSESPQPTEKHPTA
jgi:hypothetical protein